METTTVNVIDQVKSECCEVISAQAKDKNVLILRKLNESVKRFEYRNGKKVWFACRYEIEYRWLNKSINDDINSVYMSVAGNEFHQYSKKEIADILCADDLNLFEFFMICQ